jgi:molybdopterin molybdotransferase
MIPVAEARQRILAGIEPVGAEQIGLDAALGRTLAAAVAARVTQPAHAVSAMDGYAVRAADLSGEPVRLRVIGTAPAGTPFAGSVASGEAVRIFTGAELPPGADMIVIQENAKAGSGWVEVGERGAAGRYVRQAGLDFRAGEVLLAAGRILTPRDIGLAAAMNVPWLTVRRKPRIAILATGDEIVQPGEPLGPGQIVSSNSWALSALIRAHGGEVMNLGIAADTMHSLRNLAGMARGADLLITSGGASVGEHDLVKRALGEAGFVLDFWRIAMRPGKPLMYGKLEAMPVLGLPGNPVSALICSVLFLLPLLAALLGRPEHEPMTASATLGVDLDANDAREDYLRAELRRDDNGGLIATPYQRQDSSMMSTLARAGCLVVRPPFAPPLAKGSPVDIVPLGDAPPLI